MESVDEQTERADEGVHAHEHAHHEHGSHHEEPMTPEEAVRSLLLLGQVALDAGDYESAAEAFGSILQIEPNEVALYNLGSFRARGLGIARNLVEAARLYHQAELLGNERAGKLCARCMFDFIRDDLEDKSPLSMHVAMSMFVARVYPEATDRNREVNSGLYAIASTLLSQGAFAEAARVFRAAAEYGNDGYAQCYLAELYRSGAGVQQNDLAALYWFDRAVDNGAADVARAELDGMLDAYRQDLSADEFGEAMETLANWCDTSTDDVPADPDKATRWRELAG